MAVVGGLLVSQLLTLYITPVYYVYIERARLWLTSRKSQGAVQHPKRRPTDTDPATAIG